MGTRSTGLLEGRHVTLERRSSMPSELEDPEDITIGEADADLVEEVVHHTKHRHDYDDDKDDDNADDVTLRRRLSDAAGRYVLELPREVRNILAGGIAGMVAKTVVAPVDRIKILYQISPAEFHFRSLPSVVAKIVQTEGLSALWKGNMATMVRVFPYSGVQFMVFDRCKTYFLHKQQQHKQSQSERKKFGLTATESLLSGMFAGMVSVCCTYPLDLTRAQLAVLRKHRNGDGVKRAGIRKVLTDNYRNGGLPGLYRGITPTLVGILPYSGIAFALNEQGKREIQHMTGRDLKTTERMQCGAFSGLIAQSVTYPIEVTRRRMQTLGVVASNETAISNLGVRETHLPQRPPNLMTVIRNLYAEQGWRGFFKGVSMNWMKGPIAFSISFTAFDLVQSQMESEAERARRLPPGNATLARGFLTPRKHEATDGTR